MIKQFSILILITISGYFQSMDDPKIVSDKFSLSGTISGDYTGYIFLGYGTTKDSTKVINGKFKFTGQLDIPTRQSWLNLKPDPNAGILFVYLENDSDISLTLNYYQSDNGGSKTNMLKLKDIKGSKTAIIEEEYKNFWKNNKYKKNLQEHLYKKVSKLFKENPKNSFTGKTLKELAMGNPILSIDQLQKLYTLIDTTCQVKIDLELIKKKINGLKGYKIGNNFISFSLPNQNSKLINIQDYKGKYVLVDFWASWCAPCRKNNHELIKLYSKFNKEEIDFISVSIDKNKENWKKAIIKDSLNWENVIDIESETISELGIMAIPFNYLLDPQGKIIGIHLSNGDIERILLEKTSG